MALRSPTPSTFEHLMYYDDENPVSLRWWYDRRTDTAWPCTNHLQETLAHPQRYRLTDIDVSRFRKSLAANDRFDQQDDLKYFIAKGWIRITCGPTAVVWEFQDDPAGSQLILRRFAQSQEWSPELPVEWTDHGAYAQAVDRLQRFLDSSVATFTIPILDPTCYPGVVKASRVHIPGILRCVGNWLESGYPPAAREWLADITPEAKTAVAHALPDLVAEALAHQRTYMHQSGEFLSGPYAWMIPGIYRRANRDLPSKIRRLAAIVDLTCSELAMLLATVHQRRSVS